MEHPLRDYARKQFLTHVKYDKVASNIERGLYNHSVKDIRRRATTSHSTFKVPEKAAWIENRKSLTSSWECRIFRDYYKQKLNHLLTEFKRGGIVERIKSKELDLRKLSEYSPDVLRPDGLYAKAVMNKREKELAMEEAKAASDAEYTGILKCGKCKQTKTVYTQAQTRSADEVRYLLTLFLTHTNNSPLYSQ